MNILDRIKAVEDYPLDVSKGDGILYVGGGKYWPGIVVGCKLLRLIGSKLPIEVWYRDNEVVNPFDVVGLNVTLHRLSDEILNDKKHGGWAAKLEALYHTKLNRLLYMDADAYCVNDPLSLIESNESFTYWSDLPKQEKSIKWDQFYPDAPKDVPPIQGGQLFINREKVSKLIHTCRFMTRNHEYFFKVMYGDQDTWRVALNLRCSDYRVIGPADYERVAFICRKENKPYIVHRVNCKLFHVNDIPTGRSTYNTFNDTFPLEKEAHAFFNDVKDHRETNAAKVFQQIINNRLWGGGGYSCGGGSYGREAIENVDVINTIIRANRLRKVIDAGCGDMAIGKKLVAGQYIGVDVVPRPGLMVMDIANVEDLPEGDLLLSKDTIQHWPNETVHKWIESLIVSKKYRAILLITDETQDEIRDTILGGYRPLRLGQYPLNQEGFKRVGNVRQKAYYLWMKP